MPDRKEVFNALRTTHQLPVPSPTAMAVMRLCRSDSASLDEIATAIQADPLLSAEILKYANSAFLATGVQVASIQRAAVKLGMKSIAHLALCFSLLAANRRGACHAFDYEGFWSGSLARAIAGKAIAGHARGFEPDEIFTSALLSHMGELVLASIFPDDYGSLLAEQASPEARRALERERFAIDSAELTTELFLDWGLPASYALAAGFHEELDMSELGESTTRRTAELLNLACRIALLCQGGRPSPVWFAETESLAESIIGGTDSLAGLFDNSVAQWREWGNAFGVATSPCPSFTELQIELAG